MFENLSNRSSVFSRYIATDIKELDYRIKIGFLVESLLLGSYEFVGGYLPQIFIRINDPYKISLLSKDERYSNEMLRDIEQRHDMSIRIMDRFFTSDVGNDQK